MNTYTKPGLALSVLLFIPLIAAAAINKCTDVTGKVSYSDRPCPVEQGQKPAEVKNAAEFAALAAREDLRNVGKACAVLSEHRNQCRLYAKARLNAAFNEACEIPMKQNYQERQHEQYRAYRNRGYREPSSEVVEDKARPACNKVEEDMFALLKANFAQKLSPDEMKAIEYEMGAVPSDGRSNPFATRDTSPTRRARK